MYFTKNKSILTGIKTSHKSVDSSENKQCLGGSFFCYEKQSYNKITIMPKNSPIQNALGLQSM